MWPWSHLASLGMTGRSWPEQHCILDPNTEPVRNLPVREIQFQSSFLRLHTKGIDLSFFSTFVLSSPTPPMPSCLQCTLHLTFYLQQLELSVTIKTKVTFLYDFEESLLKSRLNGKYWMNCFGFIWNLFLRYLNDFNSSLFLYGITSRVLLNGFH